MKEQLKAALALLQEKHEFKVGDLVEWKGLGIRDRKPEGPFIIVEILDEPITDSANTTGDHYFGQVLDIRAAFFSGDGKFVDFLLSSDRFQPVAE